MSFIPPHYDSAQSSQSIPSYSSEPLAGERRLEHSPPVAHRPIPTGIFTKDNGRVSLLLTQQEHGAALPTYGRNSIIRGVVFPKHTENVFAVTVNVVMDLSSFIAYCSLLCRSTVFLILQSQRVLRVTLPWWRSKLRCGIITHQIRPLAQTLCLSSTICLPRIKPLKESIHYLRRSTIPLLVSLVSLQNVFICLRLRSRRIHFGNVIYSEHSRP